MDALSSIMTLAKMIGIGDTGGNRLQVIQRDITRIEHNGVVIVRTMLTGDLLHRYFRRQEAGASVKYNLETALSGSPRQDSPRHTPHR